MSYTCDRPHFTVGVDSAFISAWQWAIHASVEFRTLGLAGVRPEIRAEAQLELMIGISREARAGRDRGARTVVVIVDGDSEVASWFRGWGPLGGSVAAAREFVG